MESKAVEKLNSITTLDFSIAWIMSSVTAVTFCGSSSSFASRLSNSKASLSTSFDCSVSMAVGLVFMLRGSKFSSREFIIALFQYAVKARWQNSSCTWRWEWGRQQVILTEVFVEKLHHAHASGTDLFYRWLHFCFGCESK